jgi:DNA polymerase-3 subunit delta
MPTTTLVLASTAAVPARLAGAVRKAGRVVDASVPAGRGRGQWLSDRLRDSPVHLEPAAVRLLSDHLGEDLGRLSGILDALTAAFGPGARVPAADLDPFLGEAGSTAPWALTDAIDAGDTAGALAALRRQTGAGARHPLVVLATLHRHYASMLRLDGAGIGSDAEAAEVLGLRSPFPAKKLRVQAARLGSAGIGRAITLLAGADLDVRGATGVPEAAVLEVLVARLSRLRPAGRAAAR